ncbi:MAG: hypothetical protein JW795_20215 [Chitinivibrionales bacterium]|nr:hypothetical protein [Chitinivibrionales bacterium]
MNRKNASVILFQFSTNGKQTVALKLYGTNGRCVLKQELTAPADGIHSLSVSKRMVPNGCYIAELSSGLIRTPMKVTLVN